MKRLFFICIAAAGLASCRAEYETVIQNQVVTDVVQNSRGTYRVKVRPVSGVKPMQNVAVNRGDTVQYMVLRRIK
ncbi:hypothetical protein [Foetidibacter luteolus]|uniref:hypothetical protein n=1 Tax=Foetidibacter luteolus TaxID=2608880 RepID=UPI00129BB4E1|nr:hypothetical protein [Foetidibacter luteolus]